MVQIIPLKNQKLTWEKRDWTKSKSCKVFSFAVISHQVFFRPWLVSQHQGFPDFCHVKIRIPLISATL